MLGGQGCTCRDMWMKTLFRLWLYTWDQFSAIAVLLCPTNAFLKVQYKPENKSKMHKTD